MSAIVAGVSATAIPAAFNASIFPAAVPLPPETNCLTTCGCIETGTLCAAYALSIARYENASETCLVLLRRIFRNLLPHCLLVLALGSKRVLDLAATV